MNVGIVNLTDLSHNSTRNPSPHYTFIALLIMPIITICGNGLVVVAILTQKSLKMPTNYLLLSLAVSDFLIGTIVIPFSIYSAVYNLKWYLPYNICRFYIIADVSCSTASITHLVAISIDRFYAVVRHLEYRSPRHQTRIFVTIGCAWTFSIGLGLPMGLGFVDDNKSSCEINNTSFMLYGSLFSFYLPCLLMIIMYSFVFYRLNNQLQAVRLQEHAAGNMVKFGHHLGKRNGCDRYS